MSSIPLWSIAILVTGIIIIIACLLFGFIRYRHFAHPPTDRVESSDQKRGICTFDSKSTSTASILTQSNTIQKTQNLNDTASTMQEKSTPSTQNTFHHFKGPRKWMTKKMNVLQLFPLSTTSQSEDSNISFTDNTTSLSPPPLPPKDYSSPLSLLSPAPTPSKKDNNTWKSTPIHNKNPENALPSPIFHPLNDIASREESSTHTSLSSEGISAKGIIGMEPGSRQLLEYDLESMFAWSIVDDTEDTNVEYDHEHQYQYQHRHSIASILQKTNSHDTESITSGSVHHLVRDSTVLDIDHRSLAAPSITSSIRTSVHDMTSWDPIQDKMIDHFPNPREKNMSTAINIFDATSPLSSIGMSVQDRTHFWSQSKFVSESTSSNHSSSSPASTYSSRVTLHQFKFADQDQGQKSASESPTQSEEVTVEMSSKYSISYNEHSPLMFPPFYFERTSQSPTPPPSTLPLKASSSNNEEFNATMATIPGSDIGTKTNIVHNKVGAERGIVTVSSIAVPTTKPSAAPIWSGGPRNSIISVGGTSSTKVDWVHRELQATRNTHRMSSNQGSIASRSIRSSVSQEMSSPPGSVHPRQLNQHLASKSLQANGQSHHGSGLPKGFTNEDLLVQNIYNNREGPQPTVSFSSSTVRTMIPENEPIESYIDMQKTSASIQQQQQQQHYHHHYQIQNQTLTAFPGQKHPRHEMTTDSANNTQNQDDRQEPRFVGTRIVYRQQRGTIPWSDNGYTKVTTNTKTPAQCERDRYLQSLKG